MATAKEQQLYEDRRKKLEALKRAGIDPYPATAKRTHQIGQVLKDFSKLAKSKKAVTLVGRIRAIRTHGGLAFGNLEDESGTLQFMLKEDDTGESKFRNFGKYFDVGDFLETSGTLLETKRGEKTLLVKDYKLLTKSLRALPEKWHGLTDIETKLRKRYLDMIANPEVREIFRKKSVFWNSLRRFLFEKGFLEVETPVLERVPGGAEAEPFITHHNALDQDFYLRISLELPLKRLLVGGYEKVFEIGRIFRNEGISAEHLQDYTQMEFYWAYAGYEDLKVFVREMYQTVIRETFGTLKTIHNGKEIDWAGNWPTVEFYELLSKIHPDFTPGTSGGKLKKAAIEYGLKRDDVEREAREGRLWDLIYKDVRKKLIQPQFIVRPPVQMEPLAKRDPNDNKRVLRLQIIAAGTELGKGFSELNDPQDQRARFEDQMSLRAKGDKKAQMMDEDFVEALEYGMPPAVGFGMSERLFAVLMDKSVRETVIFPPMKEK